jgi:hypothetical protein
MAKRRPWESPCFPRFDLVGGSCPEGFITLPAPAKWNYNLGHYSPCTMQEILDAQAQEKTNG